MSNPANPNLSPEDAKRVDAEITEVMKELELVQSQMAELMLAGEVPSVHIVRLEQIEANLRVIHRMLEHCAAALA